MSANNPFKILQPKPAEPPAPRPVYFDRYDGRIKIMVARPVIECTKVVGFSEELHMDFLTDPRHAGAIARQLNMDPVVGKTCGPECEACASARQR